jgi:hypothetical protein
MRSCLRLAACCLHALLAGGCSRQGLVTAPGDSGGDADSHDPDSRADSSSESSSESSTESPSDSPPGESASDSDDIEEVPGAGDPTADVFDPLSVHAITLEMDPADWADIAGNPWAKNWHQADFAWEGERVSGVGVRAFGSGSLVSGKPSLKISMDHYVDGQQWRGLDEVKLDNSSQDYGFLNERIATEVLRGADLPAGRTGYATVQVNSADVGFFVVLESIDDRFVERWFGDDSGHLYGTNEHYYGQGLNPIEGDPLTWYAPQTSAGGDATDVQALAGIVASGSDEELSDVLDLDEFARITVYRAIMGALDDFAADGNNFYLYDNHGLWQLVPWDFDAELGYPWYFDSALAVDPAAPWATSPWAYNCVTGAPFQDPVLARAIDIGTDIDALVADALAGPLDWSTLADRVETTANLIRPYVWADSLGYGSYFEVRRADLLLFLHTRLTGLTGAEVADCPVVGAGVLRAADLSPSGTVGWGSLLLDSTNWGPGFVVNGTAWCTGLFAHAPSAVTLTIPEGYGSLSGAVGLQDWDRVQTCDNGVVFSVVRGSTVLWTSDVVLGYTDAVPFGPLEVEPGAVQLFAGPNGDYSCDTAAWLDLELAPG